MQDQHHAANSGSAPERIAKLPEVITHLLKEQGVAVPYAWAYGLHPDSLHDEPQIQMFQCARQWTTILSHSKEDTRFARYCLTSAHSVRVWLQAFTTLVIPMYLKILQDIAAQASQPQTAVSDPNTTCEVIGID
jgi:hypothetical protein